MPVGHTARAAAAVAGAPLRPALCQNKIIRERATGTEWLLVVRGGAPGGCIEWVIYSVRFGGSLSLVSQCRVCRCCCRVFVAGWAWCHEDPRRHCPRGREGVAPDLLTRVMHLGRLRTSLYISGEPGKRCTYEQLATVTAGVHHMYLSFARVPMCGTVFCGGTLPEWLWLPGNAFARGVPSRLGTLSIARGVVVLGGGGRSTVLPTSGMELLCPDVLPT
eukprot:gene23727-biopygen8889